MLAHGDLRRNMSARLRADLGDDIGRFDFVLPMLDRCANFGRIRLSGVARLGRGRPKGRSRCRCRSKDWPQLALGRSVAELSASPCGEASSRMCGWPMVACFAACLAAHAYGAWMLLRCVVVFGGCACSAISQALEGSEQRVAPGRAQPQEAGVACDVVLTASVSAGAFSVTATLRTTRRFVS